MPGNDFITQHYRRGRETALNKKRLWDAVRRRFIRLWPLLAIITILGFWLIYQNFVILRFFSSPVSSTSSTSGPGEWSAFQRDPGHSGFASDDTFIPQGSVKWQFQTSAPILSSPTVSEGQVFLSTGDRRVVSLDAQNGSLLWEYPVTGPVDSSVVLAGSMAFVGLRDGRVLALEREKGALLWEFQTRNPVFASPTVYRGMLYITSGSSRLFAIDAVTGKERWNYLTSNWITTSPAVNDDVVAIVGEDRNIHVVGVKAGDNRLLYPLGVSSSSAPVIYKDKLFVSDKAGRLRALDWREQEFGFERFIRRVQAQFFIWGMLSVPPSPKGLLWAFNERSGKSLTTPAAGDGKVYVGSMTGRFYALDMETGKVIWQFQADAPISAAPSVNRNAVFAGDLAGNIYVLAPSTGTLIKQIMVDGGVSSAGALGESAIYVATEQGTLYAIQ